MTTRRDKAGRDTRTYHCVSWSEFIVRPRHFSLSLTCPTEQCRTHGADKDMKPGPAFALPFFLSDELGTYFASVPKKCLGHHLASHS